MYKDIQEEISFLRKGDLHIWLDKKWQILPVINFIFNIEQFGLSQDVKFLRMARNKVMEGKISKNSKDYIVVKQFGIESIYDKVRFIFVKSKALRSFINAKILQKLNIGTPEPIACIEKRKGRFLLTSYYVSWKVHYDLDLSEIDKEDNLKQNIFSSLAKTIKKMHDCGIVFGDLNSRNVLITKSKENITFSLVDLNRMKVRKKIGILRSMFDLSWLYIPEEYKVFFLKEYSEDGFHYNFRIYTIIKKYRLLVDRTKHFFRYYEKRILV